MTGDDPAETVQAAARATLDGGSARLRTVMSRVFEPERVAFGSEGVVDLARRVSRVEARSDVFDELTERVLRRHPGLLGDEDEDEDEDEPYVVYVQGSTAIHGTPGTWMRANDRAGPRDPLMILDLLAGHALEEATREGSEDALGVVCRRYAGRLDSRVFVTAKVGRWVPAEGWRAHVKVWVDPDGRVRRASWRQPQVGRPRSPVRPRVAPLWHTLELWDFGLPVEIELPSEVRTPSDERLRPAEHLLAMQVLAPLGAEAWRMWREWRRSQPRA